ncbi:hypothetical protein F9B74_05615 [Pelistega sp. NLN82]|uniref:YD repeat-containing protein n=1 Tax=Pelistega ratti TaxID=2652177 RepID=A0A6L9Y5N3_9BURK|nr:hypothetical protein [Pelistega ratti]NEN75802.1 hypothetical protein [Pelistega ratti]
MQSTTKWAFDLLIEKIDGEGNRWQYDYDKDSLKLRQTLTRTLYIEGKDEPIITQFKYNSLGELIELNLPDTSGQKHALFFQYDQNGNEIDRTSPQGFILKQRYDAMDCLIQQRAGLLRGKMSLSSRNLSTIVSVS